VDQLGLLIVSLAVGVGVGVLSGLLGIGGGTVLVPVFKLGYALSPIMSTATSLATIIPTSISGAISHVRRKTCVPSLGVAAGLGGSITSPVGVWLATMSPDWAIMVAAAAVIAYSAITMFSKALKAPKGKGTATAAAGAEVAHACSGKSSAEEVEARAKEPAVKAGAPSVAAGASVGAAAGLGVETAAAEAGACAVASVATTAGAAEAPAVPAVPQMTRRQLVMGVGVGAIAGVASGYVGLGGGFVMVPLMVSLFHIPMKLTSGTSLIAVALLALPAAVTQTMLGNVSWLVALAVAAGSVPGALLGARLIPRVPERTLRFIFSGFLLVGAVLLALNQTGVM
jgi:uncharacterized membrane protein YfcA